MYKPSLRQAELWHLKMQRLDSYDVLCQCTKLNDQWAGLTALIVWVKQLIAESAVLTVVAVYFELKSIGLLYTEMILLCSNIHLTHTTRLSVC